MKTLQIETVTLHDDSRMDVIRDIAAVRKDPSSLFTAPATPDTAERDRRLKLAEEILSDLATGHWVAVLDAADAPVETRMGQRILDYWRAAK